MELGFVKKQMGPLPVWAWMGLGLGGALAISVWRKNKQDAAASSPKAGTLESYKLPESMQPQITFVDHSVTTVPWKPPGGGRVPTPPGGGVTPTPVPVTIDPTPTPTPTPTPPPAPPAAPAGQWVAVTKWARGQPKGTPSTLWGIAEMVYGNGATWGSIWAAPQNANLVAKRRAPEKIQPGDRVWVPTK